MEVERGSYWRKQKKVFVLQPCLFIWWISWGALWRYGIYGHQKKIDGFWWRLSHFQEVKWGLAPGSTHWQAAWHMHSVLHGNLDWKCSKSWTPLESHKWILTPALMAWVDDVDFYLKNIMKLVMKLVMVFLHPLLLYWRSRGPEVILLAVDRHVPLTHSQWLVELAKLAASETPQPPCSWRK